jgi:hypothetical protein
MKKIFVSAIALALPAAAIAAPGDTATATGTATATVVAPIELEHVSGAALSFGTFLAGAGGTVVVNSDGTASATGVGFVSGSTTSADSFTVSGDAGRSFTISSTGGTVADGSETMAFTTAVSSALSTLDASGDGSFTVGGTLTVGANQAPGDYSGTYSATVAYN